MDHDVRCGRKGYRGDHDLIPLADAEANQSKVHGSRAATHADGMAGAGQLAQSGFEPGGFLAGRQPTGAEHVYHLGLLRRPERRLSGWEVRPAHRNTRRVPSLLGHGTVVVAAGSTTRSAGRSSAARSEGPLPARQPTVAPRELGYVGDPRQPSHGDLLGTALGAPLGRGGVRLADHVFRQLPPAHRHLRDGC